MLTFIQIASGVALIIFGIRFLRKGLDRLFGGRLVLWLSHMTKRRWKAFFSGMVVGTLVPSSTALSLITLQMLNTSRMTAAPMLAVLLGTNVGITVTVQLLAFQIQDYAGLFILLGVVGFQFLRREVLRGIGQCLLALGFIFLAMGLIGAGAATMSANPESREWMHLFAGHPILTFLFVAGFSVCVQSSTASIGFAIALSGSGLFSPELLIPWVLGANIGIGLTGLAAGWKTLEGRRLATANVLAKLVIALPFLFFPGLVLEGLLEIPGDLSREIAMFHTGYNLLVGLVAVPLTGPLTRLVRMLVVPTPASAGLPVPQSYLNEQALDSPSLALANATRETLHMADAVKLMLKYFWTGYSSRDLNLALQVQAEDDRVDAYNDKIKDYLSRVSEGMSGAESRWQFALLTFANELESVGDIIDKIMCDTLRKQTGEAVWLPDPDYEVLKQLYHRVMVRFDVALGLLASRGDGAVDEFLSGKESLNKWCREAQKTHYERLHASGGDGLSASTYFLDLMNSFRRINSHITTIGYAFTASPRKRHRVDPDDE